MAAGDWLDIACAMQVLAESAFRDSPTQKMANRSAVTAQALTFEQTGSVDPMIFMPGNNCAGVNVVFQKLGETVQYTGDISGDSVDCDLGGCEEGESVVLPITAKKWSRSCFTINTDTCANVADADARRAYALGKAIADIRVAFDKYAIGFLDSNKQDNLDAGVTSIDLGNGAWSVATALDSIGVPAADLQTAQGLAAAESVALANMLGDHFWVHGRNNWWQSQFLSSFAEDNIGCCDRTTWALYNGMRHYWDILYLDQQLTTGGNSFAVNPGSYMFVNRVTSPSSTPTLVSDAPMTYAWTVQDPTWTWSNGGRQIPVTYDIRMQRACSGRSSVGQLVNTESYEMTLTFDLVAAPPEADGSTGILHYAEQSTIV